MKAVLKPIEVVFLQPETACSGMQSEGTVLLGQHWMIVQHGKSNTATLCSRCRLGTDPDAFNPSAMPEHHLQRRHTGRGHSCTRETQQQRCLTAQRLCLLPWPLPFSATVTYGVCSLSFFRKCALEQLPSLPVPGWLPPPQVSSKTNPSAWQHFLQLRSSLEQRQTPGQPGNRNKLCE